MIIKETSDIKGKIFTHLFKHFYRYRKPNAYYKLWLKNIWFPVAIKMYETAPSKTIWIFSGLFNAFIYHFIYFFLFFNATGYHKHCIGVIILSYKNCINVYNISMVTIHLIHQPTIWPYNYSIYQRNIQFYQKRFKYHILAHIANHCL